MGDFCGDLTIVINSTLSMSLEELQNHGVRQFPGTGSSYIRPGGFSLLPWIYTVIVLTLHIPTVIIRVLRWETTQLWCLACTFLTIIVYIQGDISTGFSEETILVWTPLLLLIDAGGMSQIIFLAADENALFLRLRVQWINIKCRLSGKGPNSAANTAFVREAEKREANKAQRHPNELEAQRNLHEAITKPLYKDRSFYVAVIALLFFIVIFVLQVLGLKHAADDNKTGVVPQVQWCSSIFQPFGVAVLDGDCNVYPINQSFNRGVGCIYLPGTPQLEWLTGTVAGTSISLMLETIDLMILTFVSSYTKHHGVKMRRPWCTMFCGLAVLGVVFVCGIIYTQNLPPGITSKIWVVVNPDRPAIYSGILSPVGLKGAIIGWTDGLFGSWNQTYFGSSLT